MTASPWRAYEASIRDRLEELAGAAAEVTFDERLPGRYSATSRQVDIVVRGPFPGISPALGSAGGVVTMVVDCKCWSRPVSLPEADRFAGFVEDLGAPLALLITTEGVTGAAAQRIAGILGAVVDVVPPEEIAQAFSAYCVKCQSKIQAVDVRVVTMGNDRPASQGQCPSCGAKLFKIGLPDRRGANTPGAPPSG
jgi:hypothetical protein